MTQDKRRLGLRLAFIVDSGLAALPTCNAPLTPMPPPTAGKGPTPAPTADASPTQYARPTEPVPASKIVYTCQVFGELSRNQICLMKADGTDRIQLTTAEGADHLYPSLSPGGESVVFAANQSGTYEIYEVGLGGEGRQLTTSGNAYAPAISPDGSLIVYTVSNVENRSLWQMNRDGSNSRPLIGNAWDAAWSPDGSQILHASDRSGEIQLHIVDLDGSGLKRVTDLPGLRGRSDWSPDGHTLASYLGTSWQREIFLFEPDGSNLRQITNGRNNLAPVSRPTAGGSPSHPIAIDMETRGATKSTSCIWKRVSFTA